MSTSTVPNFPNVPNTVMPRPHDIGGQASTASTAERAPQAPVRLAHGLLAIRNADGSVTLQPTQPLTLQAEELEALVNDLAGLRASMDPPYPLDCPPLCALEPCYSPRHWVACDPLTGKILIFLRHHLFGWLGIVQTPEASLEMLKSVAVEMKNLEWSEDDPKRALH
ncbi:hypothetical protein SAMN05216350_101598 [Polaromonas sp. YR568]|uniref:hypothetical protein n=1 Tax=Polaromonas sp. YR568 TaxID=1855301 RepID=UPI0008E1BFE3|nr:hypothetical protein [Polaromonas sp. YR568]SFU37407.1 hypothetical protein SAMN05216350_101598 [Polaromonas sp. YR568]